MFNLINETKSRVCRRKTARLLKLIFDFYNIENAAVDVIIISSLKMKKLNNEFRGINKATDVLSFPSAQMPNLTKIKKLREDKFLGEVFINIDEVREPLKYQEIFQALYPEDKGRRSQEYIFYFLLTHGLLHLIGYQDKTEKGRQAMIILGEKFLAKFFSKKAKK